MIRDALTPGSAYFSLFVTGSNGLSNQWRSCDGCETFGNGNALVDGRNAWLKVSKIGNTFEAYYKIEENADWTAIGSAQTMQFSDASYVGIAVTSHDNSKTAELLWNYITPLTKSPSASPTTPSPTCNGPGGDCFGDEHCCSNLICDYGWCDVP